MKNTLKELRKQANLTQLKASNLFHVSLRTYITYENDISKIVLVCSASVILTSQAI